MAPLRPNTDFDTANGYLPTPVEPPPVPAPRRTAPAPVEQHTTYPPAAHPPQQITVNLPEQDGLSPQQRAFMLYVVLFLVVAVVLTACVCAVVVLVGGTLMGIIGTVTANAVPLMVSLIGVIAVAGWAAGKAKALGKGQDTRRGKRG